MVKYKFFKDELNYIHLFFDGFDLSGFWSTRAVMRKTFFGSVRFTSV